jgi:membrane-associated protein
MVSLIQRIIDFILHIDKHLDAFVTEYGMLTYALLFGIIFIETGIVIMPFLP